jgi:Flp pilus assembly protein CpaB
VKNYRLAFIVFVVCAALVAILVANGYNSIAKMTTVAVAKQDINPNEAATPTNVGITKIPKGAVNSSTVVDPKSLEGYSARGFIPAGTVLTTKFFQPVKDAGAEAALSLRPGLVGVALEANVDTTVGDEIRPGSRVNVISSKEGNSLTIASAAEVLTVKEKSVVVGLQKETADRLIAERQNKGQIVLELLPAKEGDET